jgi:2-dehydro-3-deoxyphosphogluconate aldolase/(4S)-4-hydroxy-2-oxoglutarate aldolase
MSHKQRQDRLASLLRNNPIVPVITIERVDDAVPLAEALVKGGIRAVEITLRTAAGFDCAAAIIRGVPEAIVGIGTIMTPDDLVKSMDIGAIYALSPGATPELLDAAGARDFPFVPGIGSASELMAALARGFDICKLFPAVPLGGLSMIKALAGPFPQARFCPTGGIGEADAPEWLAHPNVLAVGGSWIAPAKDIKAGAWSTITENARRIMEALN